ncbi:MAG: ribosome maturation factor RimP [Streptosporangiaceae bacterium]
MHEGSRRGAPRSARAANRTPGGRDTRGGGIPGRASAAEVARISGLIEPVLAAMEIDLEGIKIGSAGRRRVLRIIVDADGGVSLDDIAEVSREVSARLDAGSAMGDAPYTLEVSSPGVDRPLTQPRHWRRAAGRLVAVPIAAGNLDAQRDAPAGPVARQARVIDADEDGVTLEIDGVSRFFDYADLGPGRVQVEFTRRDEADGEPGDGDFGDDGDDDDGDDVGDSADEEDPDGY